MKTTLRVPTAEPYAYVEFELDAPTIGDAMQLYKEATAFVTGGVGMDTREFNAVLDELMTKNSISGDPGMVERMNIEQQSIIQAVKRSRARTNK